MLKVQLWRVTPSSHFSLHVCIVYIIYKLLPLILINSGRGHIIISFSDEETEAQVTHVTCPGHTGNTNHV